LSEKRHEVVAYCADADLLDHCRRQEVHVRGCWLLDAELGKQP
jgi:hypothetical protein